jgi:hypothetical protein
MITLDNGIIIAHEQFDVINQCTAKKPVSFKTVDNYTEFILWSLKQTFSDNLFFHEIPESFKAYSNRREIDDTMMTLYFNIMDPASGDIYEHVFLKHINLVALDMKSNADELKAITPPEFITALASDNIGLITKCLEEQGFDGCITRPTDKLPYMIHIFHPVQYVSTGKLTDLVQN